MDDINFWRGHEITVGAQLDLYDEQQEDFEERLEEWSAIPGCSCRPKAVNMGTPYYRTVVDSLSCPVHG